MTRTISAAAVDEPLREAEDAREDGRQFIQVLVTPMDFQINAQTDDANDDNDADSDAN